MTDQEQPTLKEVDVPDGYTLVELPDLSHGLLCCNRCGTIVIEPDIHTRWHTLSGGPFGVPFG